MQLANTINLEACEDLDDYEYVRRSVLNYGLIDLSDMTSEDLRLRELSRRLARALVAHEPRFVEATLSVKMRREFDEVHQKIAFDVHAEMACKPVDIPMEFVAEIDVGSMIVLDAPGAERFAEVSARRMSMIRRNSGMSRGQRASPRVESSEITMARSAPIRVETAAMFTVSSSAGK